jgi:hypothetical protein
MACNFAAGSDFESLSHILPTPAVRSDLILGGRPKDEPDGRPNNSEALGVRRQYYYGSENRAESPLLSRVQLEL